MKSLKSSHSSLFKTWEKLCLYHLSFRLMQFIYLCINKASVDGPKLVQNAAVRLLTGTKDRDDITPVLASLQWFPVHYMTQFKVLLFVFKALNNLAHLYHWSALPVLCSQVTKVLRPVAVGCSTILVESWEWLCFSLHWTSDVLSLLQFLNED